MEQKKIGDLFAVALFRIGLILYKYTHTIFNTLQNRIYLF